MPVYIRFDGVDGSVEPAGNGGVWKTSNFLTREPLGRGPGGGPTVKVFDGSTRAGARPKIKTFLCPSDGSAVEVSSISLVPGVGGVEGRDPAAKMKVEQLMNIARSRGPQGKLYLATDQGVYNSGGANRLNHTNNLRQIGLAAHGPSTVEIIVTDAVGNVTAGYRFERAFVSRHPGGINVGLCDGSVR